MTRARWTALASSLLVTTLMASSPAVSSPYTLEAFGGFYQPDATDDNGSIFGLRFAAVPEDWGTMVSVGVIDLDQDFFQTGTDDLEFSIILLDTSVVYSFGDDGNFQVLGGIGWADIDIRLEVPYLTEDIEGNDGTFTLHAGLAYRFDLGDDLYLRPEARARWFDGQDFDLGERASYDGLDTEVTVALGWRF